MPVCIGFTMLDYLASEHVRALADGDHRVIARVASLVLNYQPGQSLGIERYFRNQGAIHAGKVRADQAGFTTVPTEQLDNGDTFVRAAAGPKLVNELNATGYRRTKADTVIGAKYIVIHRLRDSDYFDAFS